MSDDPGWVAYTALGLSVISTLRPEIEAGYYRFVKPAAASIDLLPQITLGVNTYGPYLQLSGVLTVSHGSLLMRRMSVTLERAESAAAVAFQAKFFVGTEVDTATNASTISMPIPFSVDEGKPVPFSTAFVSTADAKAFEHALVVLRDGWATFSTEQNTQPSYPGRYAPAQDPWSAFRKDPRYAACVAMLGAHSFWTAGTYRFALAIDTNGRAPRAETFGCTLTPDDIARIVASIPRIPDSTFGYGDPRLAWTAVTVDTNAGESGS